MTIRIIKADEPREIGSLVTVIYGQPGIGKTTLACTADSPLLLDFDAGTHRAAVSVDTVPLDGWRAMTALTEAELKPYRTIIIDTGGQCVNALKRHIISNDPKMATSHGGLTLNGYGVLKDKFGDFVAKIRGFQKDLVIVMHATEQKNSEAIELRLDVAGGSKDEIHRVADVMGLLRLGNKGERRLILTPTLAGYAKNPIGLRDLEIGDVKAQPQALGYLHTQVRQGIAGKAAQTANESVSEPSADAPDALAEDLITQAHGAGDLDSINMLFSQLLARPRLSDAQKRAFHLAAKGKGYEYSKTTGAYIDPAVV